LLLGHGGQSGQSGDTVVRAEEVIRMPNSNTQPGHERYAGHFETVLRYHERSKHDFNAYARGPGRLDWANQPNPFRRFDGAPLIALPLLGAAAEPLAPRYDNLYNAGSVPSAPLTLHSLSRLFEYSLAISAWKQAGSTRWALRCNPSSGNLHPTEAYLLTGPLAGLAERAGMYHYAASEHALELRAECSHGWFAELTRELAPRTFLIGLASIHWREAWKYGERAFRYCQHDLGHAIGALRFAAATLGWSACVLEGISDDAIEHLLGLDRAEDFADAEREHPGLMLAVWPSAEASHRGAPLAPALRFDPDSARELSHQRWHGTANRLSRAAPVLWEAIDEVALASYKSNGDAPEFESPPASARQPEAFTSTEGLSAHQIILQRRSLLACDGRTSIAAARFYRMLARVMPRADLPPGERPPPWDAIAWGPTIHLGLFVHRVDGIAPGLYALARDRAALAALQSAMHTRFEWSAPPLCPADLPLRLLQRGDARQLATQLSCHQDIAGDGAFSLGMIAAYQQSLVAHGPGFYRRLFWEAGLIGQVLYLEAEAAGVRATGIGCYFDDPVHRVFGLEGLAFQSLYHFTVGGPVEDPRLTTLAPYEDRGGGSAVA
jgi:SagB-type dehydrogenase family enzyme